MVVSYATNTMLSINVMENVSPSNNKTEVSRSDPAY